MEAVPFDVVQVQCANKRQHGGFFKHCSAILVPPARLLGMATLGAVLRRSGDLDRAHGAVAAATDGMGSDERGELYRF
jgi:hypothetical protein